LAEARFDPKASLFAMATIAATVDVFNAYIDLITSLKAI
jgi:hypothetical protein